MIAEETEERIRIMKWEKMAEFVARGDNEKELERRNLRRMYTTLDIDERFGVEMQVDTKTMPSYLLHLLPPVDGSRFVSVRLAENFAAVGYLTRREGRLEHRLIVFRKVKR